MKYTETTESLKNLANTTCKECGGNCKNCPLDYYVGQTTLCYILRVLPDYIRMADEEYKSSN